MKLKARNITYFIFLSLICIVSSYTCFGSINTNQNQWNATEYAVHSKSQNQDAMALLKKIHFKGNERILDLGCGDGKFALFLANSHPQSYLLGIDPSVPMINKAKSGSLPTNINFKVDRGETFSLDEKFDFVISVHAMHWIKDQQKALKNIYNHLNQNGKIYLVFSPSKDGLPFDAALKNVMAQWRKEFSKFENNQYFYDLEAYRKLLISAGFQVQNLSYILKEREYTDVISLGSWVKQWLPHYKFLPDEKKELFFKDLMDAYALEMNVKPNQKIKWDEYVIQVEAIKPINNTYKES